MAKMEKTSHSTNYNHVGQEKMAAMGEELVERIDELFDVLGVTLRREKRKYVGCCPVHGGDRDNALNLFYEGNSMVGNWKCRSHSCHERFKPTIVGFIRGVLSNRELNWESPGDEMYSFHDTIKFITGFLGSDLDKFSVDLSKVEKSRSGDHTNRFYAKKQNIKNKIPRATVRKFIVEPTYYIDRNYSKKILDKYDVSFCNNPKKPMYKRCVTPIYDDDHKFMVGCTGRSIFEKCGDCGGFHDPNRPCPLPDEVRRYSKWKHSYQFAAEEWLYNYWYAKRYILETKCAVLVESPGNVWRLEEAGIHNSLGLFGIALNDGQLDSLNRCGAMNILLALDNDDAGSLGAEPIIEELSNLYNVEVLDISGADIGDMTPEQVKKDLLPQIERFYV